eukprot:361784-Chlamydomonas_euryale.AAC.2
MDVRNVLALAAFCQCQDTWASLKLSNQQKVDVYRTFISFIFLCGCGRPRTSNDGWAAGQTGWRHQRVVQGNSFTHALCVDIPSSNVWQGSPCHISPTPTTTHTSRRQL